MSSPTSIASEYGQDISKVKTKSLSKLSPEQLARKRANDRDSQRAIRARNKDLIARLQREVEELRNNNNAKAVQGLLRRNEALESEIKILRQSMGFQSDLSAQTLDNPAGDDLVVDCSANIGNSKIFKNLHLGDRVSIPRRLEDPSLVWATGHHNSGFIPGQQQSTLENRNQMPQGLFDEPRRGAWNSPISIRDTSGFTGASSNIEELSAPTHASESASGPGLVLRPHPRVLDGPEGAQQQAESSQQFYGVSRHMAGQPPEAYNNLNYFMTGESLHRDLQ